MIRVDEALKIILKSIKPLDSEVVKLTSALGRVLADDIYADSDIPAFNNSAMDGYAVRSCDTTDASKDKPKVLEVIDELKAGDMPKKALKAHQAIRIMTGAPVPKGADNVIMVEDTQKAKGVEHRAKCIEHRAKGIEYRAKGIEYRAKGVEHRVESREFVKIFKEVKSGENVRMAGEDIRKGEQVLERGLLLRPAHIGILASLGIAKVKVTRKPQVAVLATGDEVVDVGKKLKLGKIRSSNSYTLFNQILECGGSPKNLGIAADEPRQLENKIRTGLDCDVILTSGGVSVGDYDLVKDILAKMGTDIRFWKVAMRPGKPLVFGTIRGIPVFGLPGNPVSSMISFEVFVRPAILKMLGQKDGLRRDVEAVLERDIEKKRGLCYFLRAYTRWQQGKFVADTTGSQGSAILKSMALANSLIILPEEDGFVRKGRSVKVRFLN